MIEHTKRRPRVAFIASREPSYPRVSIVEKALREHFETDSFVSLSKHYPVRICVVLGKFAWAAITGRLRRCDLVVVGFFAQPILPFVRCCWRRALVSDGFFSLFDTFVQDKARVGPQTLIARLSKWLDRFMLGHSDLVLTDTEAHAGYFREEFRNDTVRTQRIFASAQDDLFRRLPPRSLDEGEKFEVLFWGGFIPLQGVEVILQAAHQLAADRYHFTIVGEGQTAAACHALASQLSLENVSFLGWQKLTGLVDLSCRAHVLLGIFGTTDKAARVIPNKAFQAMAQAKPLITGESPAANELLQDGHDALLVPRGDPAALADRISWAAENYGLSLEIGARGYRTFMDRASPARVSELLHEHVSACLDSAKHSKGESDS
jgi:glycosyltransferase involved in cell wall biosynthesis